MAEDLPDLGTGKAAVIVSSSVGVLMISAVVLTLVWASDGIGPLLLVLGGSALLVAALDAAGVGPGACTFEALLAGSLGAVVGRLLAAPIVAVAIPVFVALVDAWSVASGPSSRLIHGEPRGTAELTFALPSWGNSLGDVAAHVGLTDAVFLAMFATWTIRFDLRPRLTAVCMVAGLIATIVISVLSDRAIPALPLLAVGYVLPNVDRLASLLRHQG